MFGTAGSLKDVVNLFDVFYYLISIIFGGIPFYFIYFEAPYNLIIIIF